MSKLPMWRETGTRNEAEAQWDAKATHAAQQRPLRGLRRLPNMVGITPETAKNLKAKSFWYMLRHDTTGGIRRGFLRHPLRYGRRLLRSLWKTSSYKREEDFFLYGIDSLSQFSEELRNPDALFVIGFSYCHKPFECPSGRFTNECIADTKSPVCQQCFIGKCMHLRPANSIPLIIPTVHYIGEKIFEIVHAHPGREVLFLITACEMTLRMFGDWGNMAGIRGAGVRLDGRICNTMRAFELSEAGVKPGLTVVLDDTKQKILDLLTVREFSEQSG